MSDMKYMMDHWILYTKAFVDAKRSCMLWDYESSGDEQMDDLLKEERKHRSQLLVNRWYHEQR